MAEKKKEVKKDAKPKISRKAPPGMKWIQLEKDEEAFRMQIDNEGKLLPAGEGKLAGYDPKTKQALVRL